MHSLLLTFMQLDYQDAVLTTSLHTSAAASVELHHIQLVTFTFTFDIHVWNSHVGIDVHVILYSCESDL